MSGADLSNMQGVRVSMAGVSLSGAISATRAGGASLREAI